MRSKDGQRLYADDAMFALSDALSRGLSIASAIAEARNGRGSARRRRGLRAGGQGYLFVLPNTPEEA
jgi:hypothetical protein